MMRKLKKPIAFILTIVMTFALVCVVQPTTALAAPGDTGVTGSWYWEVLDDGTLAITGFDHAWDSEELNLTITNTLNTGSGPVTVSAIGNGVFSSRTMLKSISLPSTLKNIGNTAFGGCSGLTTITLPEGLESIGASAFEACTSLAAITIPSSVTTVSTGAFSACYGLETVVISGGAVSLNVGDGVFASCSDLSTVTLNRLDRISFQMFSYCPDLQTITIPASVTSIASSAFGSNNAPGTGLTSIVIPDTVTSIGNSAFQYCTKLTSAVLPENATFTAIPSGLFMGCSSLTSVDIPPTITSIGSAAFGNCGFTSFTIPNTITSIGSYLFQNCTTLSSITLPANPSITSVPAGLAVRCTSLESITIPANMTSIGNSAFSETGLQSFTVPDHVTSIGAGAFNECEFLTDVTMSANVTNIGNYAFSECPLLTRVTIPGINVSISPSAFDSSALVGATGSGIGIYGLTGSDVQTYASNSGIQFNSIGSVPVAPVVNPGSPSGSTPPESPKPVGDTAGNTYTATTTVTAKTDSSGNTTATVTKTQLNDTINKAVAEANKQGGDTKAIVEIKVEAPAASGSVTTGIPKDAIGLAASGGTDALKISTPVASLSFDTEALSTISGEAAGEVKITTTKVDAASLPEATQQLVGDRPIFNFSVTSGNSTISEFGGNVTVAVPYIPKAGEDPDSIVIYYINSQGQPEMVSNCAYDPATGTVSFTTDHFSQYAVGYNKVSFSDVKAGTWYENAVEFTASRGIVMGTGNGNFSPDGKLTRGQLLVMLMRAYGIEPDTDLSNNFSDAGDTYYTGYLAAAKRLDITEGLGNNLYAPDKQITRQEMFTILYNTLKVIGQLPEGTGNASGALTGYSDADSVSSWAKDAAGALANAEIISGSGGKISPKNTTTRAEMAQVLYNLLSK